MESKNRLLSLKSYMLPNVYCTKPSAKPKKAGFFANEEICGFIGITESTLQKFCRENNASLPANDTDKVTLAV